MDQSPTARFEASGTAASIVTSLVRVRSSSSQTSVADVILVVEDIHTSLLTDGPLLQRLVRARARRRSTPRAASGSLDAEAGCRRMNHSLPHVTVRRRRA